MLGRKDVQQAIMQFFLPVMIPVLFPNYPQMLLDRSDSILLVASDSPSGTTYYMVNIHRVDDRDLAIDQEPFGLAFFADEPAPSGCFIHHGNWFGRTTYPPQEFWRHIVESGIGNCYPISELPQKPFGRLEELNIQSQEEAFRVVVEKMRETVGE